VYRRIPNFGTFYDYANGLVDVSLFVPRLKDAGVLSAYLSRDDAYASLELPRHRGYGICVLDIARMRDLAGDQVGVEFAPTGAAFGASHAKIHGCTDEGVRDILSLIAEVELAPDKTLA